MPSTDRWTLTLKFLSVGEKIAGVFALDGCTGAIDLSGNKNDGTAVNVDPQINGPKGIYAKATGFGGQTKDSYILINNTGSLDTLYSLSMLMHVYPEKLDGTLLAYSNGGCTLTLEGKVLTFTAVGRDGTKSETVIFDLGILNQWYYIAAVYDSNIGKMMLYVNEELAKETTINDVFMLNTAGSVWVGTNPDKNKYFSGKISCIQIFDRPLTKEQIHEGVVCPTGVGADLPGKETILAAQ